MMLRCLLVASLAFFGTSYADDVQYYTLHSKGGRGLRTPYSHHHLLVPGQHLVFQVKAEQSAKLALLPQPYQTGSGDRYEVVLGDQSNMATVVRQGLAGGSADATKVTRDILSPTEYRDFWLSWGYGSIKVGRGRDPMVSAICPASDGLDHAHSLECVILSWKPRGEPQYNYALSLDTGIEEAWWRIPRGSVPTLYLTTTEHDAQGSLWVPVTKHMDSLVFSLRGGGPNQMDRLVLCPQITTTIIERKNACWLIILADTHSQIVSPNNEQKVVEPTWGLVSATERHFFWISWHSGMLEVGSGHEIGFQRLLAAPLNRDTDIQTVGVLNGDHLGSLSEFHLNSDNRFLLERAPNEKPQIDNWLDMDGRHTFTFQVQACHTAEIGLMSNPIDTNATIDIIVSIDVIPDRNESRRVHRVKYSREGIPSFVREFEADEPVLSCSEMRPFWLLWGAHEVRLGRGSRIGSNLERGEDLISDIEPTSMPVISGLVLLNAQEKPLANRHIAWDIPADSGKTVILNTEGDDAMKFHWLSVLDQQSVVFSVRTCGQLYIIMAQYMSITDHSVYSLYVGEETMIVKGVKEVSENTPDVLSCTDFRYIWLAWHGGRVSIGQGMVPGEDHLLTLDDSKTDPFLINAIMFGAKNAAEWHFGTVDGPYYILSTKSAVTDNAAKPWLDCPRSMFTFTAQSCHDVAINLSPSPPPFAEVVGYIVSLGSMYTTIYDPRADNSKVKSPIKWTCSAIRLWIFWGEDSIRVGYGDLFLNEFISHPSPRDQLQRIAGVSLTSTPGNVTRWLVPKATGNLLQVSPTVWTPTILTTDAEESVAFLVTAACDVRLVLSAVLEPHTANTVRLEVVFGAEDGHVTSITNLTSGSTLREDTPSVVSGTEARWFWVSWSSGSMQAGRGNVIGNQRLVSLQTLYHDLPIHFITASSPPESEWQFSNIHDRMFSVITTPEQYHQHVRMRTTFPYFQFRLRTCQEAMLELLSATDPDIEWAYQIFLGAEENTRLRMLDTRFQGDFVLDVSVPDMTSCNEMRNYWVTWDSNVIRIGRGVLPGYTVAEYRDFSMQNIVGIALGSTEPDLEAVTDSHWEFSESAVQSIRVDTRAPKDLHLTWLTVVHQTEVTFRLHALEEVYIGLSKIPEVTDSFTYIIMLGGGNDGHGTIFSKDSFAIFYDGVIIACTERKGLMSDPKNEDFNMWRISWAGDTILVMMEYELLFNVAMREKFAISALSIGSDDNSGSAQWEFENTRGTSYYFCTDSGLIPQSTRIHVDISDVHSNTLEFRVRTSQSTTLTLISRLEEIDNEKIEVVIGEYTNKQIRASIKRTTKGNTIVLASTVISGSLWSHEGKQYWISWEEGVQLGRGNLGSNPLLTTPEGLRGTSAIGFSSGDQAYWTIRKQDTEALVATTPMHVGDQVRIWEGVGGASFSIINVRACSDISIYLSSTPDKHTALYLIDVENTYEMGKTGIVEISNSSHSQYVTAEKILNCEDFRTVWVSWRGSEIRVGKGSEVGENLVVRLDRDTAKMINHVGLTTPPGELAEWYMLEAPAHSYLLRTDGNTLLRQHTFYMGDAPEVFAFSVQACENVLVALETSQPEADYDYSMYEVYIGAHGNQQSFIRRRGQMSIMEKVSSPLILSCTERRSFWITYSADGLIEVGTGDTLEHSFLSWRVPGAAPLRAVYPATDGCVGRWFIDEDRVGTTFHFEDVQKAEPSINTWVSTAGLSSLKFYLRADADARLLLSAVPGQYGTLSWELRIDYDYFCTLYDGYYGMRELMYKYTDYVLNEKDHQEFWISWDHTGIRFGKGGEVGLHHIFHYTVPEGERMHPVNGIGLYSGEKQKDKNNPSNWIMGNITDTAVDAPLRDDVIQLLTSCEQDARRRMWNIHGTGFTFSVMAQASAIIYLSPTPGVIDEGAGIYKIVIGDDDNSMTRITMQGSEVPRFNHTKTPGILKGEEERLFWLSWTATAITLGKGTMMGQQPVIMMPNMVGFDQAPIHTVGLASACGVKARWKFYKDAGRYFNITQRNEFDVWHSLYNDDALVFQAKRLPQSEEDTEINILLSNSLNQTDRVYHIMLSSGFSRICKVYMCDDPYWQEMEYTPDLLSTEELRYFWVTWHQGVQVGRGRLPGKDRFIEFQSYIPKNVNFASFAGSKIRNNSAEFHLHNTEEDSYTVTTVGDNSYHHAWVYPRAEHFKFEVTGCEAAMLFLAKDALVADDKATGYDVFIGSHGGTGLVIRDHLTNTVHAITSVDGLLKCHSTRSFWITWYEQEISFGRGTHLFKHVILDGVAVNFKIRALSLTAAAIKSPIGWPFNIITWDFDKAQARSTVFETKADEELISLPRHWLNTWGTHSIKFKVKSAGAVNVLLSKYFAVSGEYAYELVVDDARQSEYYCELRASEGGTPQATRQGRLLSEHYAKWFWIAWPGDSIHVGSGPIVGNNVLLSWAQNHGARHDIEAIGFHSEQDDSWWELTEQPDLLYEVETSPFDSATTWVYMHREYFTFSVQTSANAHLLLRETEHSEAHSYIVGIDDTVTEKGVSSSIKYPNGTVLATSQVEPVGYLDRNSYERFWVSWISSEGVKGEITVGQGDLFQGVIMHAWAPWGVHVVGIEAKEDEAHWLFRDDAGMMAVFNAPPQKSYDRYMYRVASIESLVFWVATKSDACIALFDNYHTSFVYEIVIGAENGQYVYIKNKEGDTPANAAHTPDIVHAEETTPFWITWHGGRVVVGWGEVVGDEQIMQHTEEEQPNSISYIAFSSGGTFPSKWSFYNITDDTFYFTTHPERFTNADDVWFTFAPDQRAYSFTVRACYGGIVKLLTGGQTTDVLFTLMLGASNNQETILYRKGEQVAREPSPDILNCYEDRKFLLRWSDSVVQLLVGGDAGSCVLEYVDGKSFTDSVHGITLSTTYAVYGEWALPRSPGKALRLHSGYHLNPYRSMWLTVIERNFVVLSVRGCSDASLALSEVPGVPSGNAYEIILGANHNTESLIKHGVDGEVKAQQLGNHLQCSKFNSFWISWGDTEETLIQVGPGTNPGGSVFLSYEPNGPGFPVRALSVANRYKLQPITWEFSQIAGNQFHAHTTSSVDYNQVLIVPQREQFVFGVKAAGGVHLALSTTPDVTNVQTFEVMIGSENNSVVAIRDVDHDEKTEGVLLPGAVTLEETRMFWLDWSHTTVRLGRGAVVGLDPIHEYDPGEPLQPINAIALATADGPGTWEWDFNQEKLIRFAHTDDPSPRFSWLTVVGFYSLVFRVRACDTAQLVLSSIHGDTERSSSRIVLGDISYITASLQGDHPVAEAYTKDVISCSEFRAIWVEWSARHISVGSGADTGHNDFLVYYDDNLHYTAAIALLTSPDDSAQWEIGQLTGNSYTVFTPGDGEYNYFEVTPAFTELGAEFIFSVKARKNVQLALLPDEESLERGTPYYELLFGAEDNSKTILNKHLIVEGKVVALAVESTPSMLHDDISRQFWVQWSDDGQIRAGSGHIPSQYQILRYHDAKPVSLRRVMITSTNNEAAEWLMQQNPGDVATYITPKDLIYNTTFINILDQNFVTFKVAACQGAHIALSGIPGVVDYLTYEVILGADDNRAVEVRQGVPGTKDGKAGQVLATAKLANMVNCMDMRPFWITWDYDAGILLVGAGNNVGNSKEQVLRYGKFNLESVNTISLATFTGNKGRWQLEYLLPEPGYSTLPLPVSTPTPQPVPTTTPTSRGTTPTSRGTTPTSRVTTPTPSLPTAPRVTEAPRVGMSDGEAGALACGLIVLVGIVTALLYLTYRQWFIARLSTQPVRFENEPVADDVTFDAKVIFGSAASNLHMDDTSMDDKPPNGTF